MYPIKQTLNRAVGVHVGWGQVRSLGSFNGMSGTISGSLDPGVKVSLTGVREGDLVVVCGSTAETGAIGPPPIDSSGTVWNHGASSRNVYGVAFITYTIASTQLTELMIPLVSGYPVILKAFAVKMGGVLTGKFDSASQQIGTDPAPTLSHSKESNENAVSFRVSAYNNAPETALSASPTAVGNWTGLYEKMQSTYNYPTHLFVEYRVINADETMRQSNPTITPLGNYNSNHAMVTFKI